MFRDQFGLPHEMDNCPCGIDHIAEIDASGQELRDLLARAAALGRFANGRPTLLDYNIADRLINEMEDFL